MPAEGDSVPGLSLHFTLTADHQATKELAPNLALPPSKTCFTGRDSAAEVRSASARIITILVLRMISCKPEVESSCSLLILKGVSLVSFLNVVDDRHLHPFSG